MIITECPECNAPIMVPFQIEFLGKFRHVECDECPASCWVEMRTFSGTCYPDEHFIVGEDRKLSKHEPCRCADGG